MHHVENVFWVLLPGFVAVASGMLVWFVMESRMEVKLAQEKERLARERNSVEVRKAALEGALEPTIQAAEERARRMALEAFLDDLRVEQRHYTRENRALSHTRKSLVLQERMYFRSLPLSDWIEHEVALENESDVQRLVREMTVFDKPVVNVAEGAPPRKALA
jgi:hypothetical protein